MEVDEVSEFMATDLEIIGYVAFVYVEEEQFVCFAHQFLWFMLDQFLWFMLDQFLWFMLGVLHSLEVEWKKFNVSIFGKYKKSPWLSLAWIVEPR